MNFFHSIKVSKKNIDKLMEIYPNIKQGDNIEVLGKDLIKLGVNSYKIKIKLKCKMCNKEIESYVANIKTENILCKKCKTKQTNLKKYGVENVFQSKEIKEKIKQTNLEKYGVENVSQNENIKNKKKETCIKNNGVNYGFNDLNKVIKTNLEKYGVENVSQNENIKNKKKETCIKNNGVSCGFNSDKAKQTILNKYGVENVFKNEEIKEKIKQTNLKKYGVSNVFQSKQIKEKIKQTNLKKYGAENPMQNYKIKQKAINSLYKNSTGPCSKQQKYLCELLGGKLNYPVNNLMLDIAFPEKMIYIEYNGGGHYVWPQKRGLTIEEINDRDLKRFYILQKYNWKLIKIVSKKDKLINDNEIIIIIYKLFNILKDNKSNWMEVNIDEKLIIGKNFKIAINDFINEVKNEL